MIPAISTWKGVPGSALEVGWGAPSLRLGLGAELLLLLKKGVSQGEYFWVCPTEKSPRSRPRTRWRVWERLGSHRRSWWCLVSLLDRLPPWINSRRRRWTNVNWSTVNCWKLHRNILKIRVFYGSNRFFSKLSSFKQLSTTGKILTVHDLCTDPHFKTSELSLKDNLTPKTLRLWKFKSTPAQEHFSKMTLAPQFSNYTLPKNRMCDSLHPSVTKVVGSIRTFCDSSDTGDTKKCYSLNSVLFFKYWSTYFCQMSPRWILAQTGLGCLTRTWPGMKNPNWSTEGGVWWYQPSGEESKVGITFRKNSLWKFKRGLQKAGREGAI